MSSRIPKVSIIIPTHNYGKFIERAVNSVLSQTYQDYEVIIVDDASIDDTKEIVRQFDDARVRYLRHDINKGPSAARNTGIRSSQGKLIAFLDSDDEWFPDKLYQQVHLFEKSASAVGLVYCGVQNIDSLTLKKTEIWPKRRGDLFKLLLDANIICGCDSSLIIRKKVFDALGFFDENMKSSEDWDMWLRMSQVYQVDYVDRILVRLWSHEGNISADMKRTIRGREALLEKNKKIYDLYPKIHSTQYYRLGIMCYKHNLMPQGRRHFMKAFSLADTAVLKTKCMLQYALSLAGFKTYIHFRKKLIGD